MPGIQLPERHKIAWDPELVPPVELMLREGISVLEEWFRWGDEWSMLLCVYGHMTRGSSVLEIGCGLGRVAFPLRYVLSGSGSYDGFEICQYKIEFLERTFHQAYPNFRFVWADLHNSHYNPRSRIAAREYRFPYPDGMFDIVYAASVFTHMLPDTTAHYFRETARVLKPGGRAVFSCFLLDNYRPGQPRPLGFSSDGFNFDYPYEKYGNLFAIAAPADPEQMTAYRLELLERFAADAQLSVVQAPVSGFWSGTTDTWVGAQDLLVLEKPKEG